MASAAPITDHDEIRRWAEKNGGRPACVKGAGKGEDPIYGQKQGQKQRGPRNSGERGDSQGRGARQGHGRPQGGQGHGHGAGRSHHDGQQGEARSEGRGETQGRGRGPNRNRRRRPGGGGGAKTPMSGSWSPSAS